ncbi:MAG TPA: AarF/UbiB family protein, partial [Acidimicrobiales bacterium]|nr:AarF/UbiB family protein [Acidimicrobiales bacterium]
DASETSPADLEIGAFSRNPPWDLSAQDLPWRAGSEQLRSSSAARVPELLRRRRLPPGQRVVVTSARLGAAILAWTLVEKRRANRAGRREISRAGLSHRLRKAFERLGPTYIKLGQILSSGEGVFPPELVNEFRLLRDRVPAEPFDVVREVVEAELGRPLEDVFEHFERAPVAAASIAQVHAARLRTGEEVVAKVQRPHVSTLVQRDIAAMSWLAPLLIGRIPVAALANPPALVELFAETIVEELDFRLEADNMLDIARVLAETGQRAVVVPRPHPELVTRRLLVMERLDGFCWDDVEGMRQAGIDTSAVVRALLIAFLEGATLFGVFHGDLHGGNLFVQPDGRVALLDYGITGRLDELRRVAFLRLLMGASLNDPQLELAALRDMGAVPVDTDLDALVKDLGLDKPVVDVTTLAPEALLAQVREVTKRLLEYGAKFPKILMLFVKDLLFVDGSLATLAPDIDLFAEVAEIAAYFTSRYGDRIAHDIGIDPRQHPLEISAVRAAVGVGEDVEELTYRDLQARRELISRRMEEHRRRRERPSHHGRWPFGRGKRHQAPGAEEQPET